MNTPRNRYRDVLVVEDSDEDYEALRRAFHGIDAQIPIQRVADGDAALDYLFRRGEHAGLDHPGIVVLDLNLPGTDGREVLEIVKGDRELATLPIIVLTTSDSAKDVEGAYRDGANCYVQKPVRPGDFSRTIASIKSFWLDAVVLPV